MYIIRVRILHRPARAPVDIRVDVSLEPPLCLFLIGSLLLLLPCTSYDWLIALRSYLVSFSQKEPMMIMMTSPTTNTSFITPSRDLAAQLHPRRIQQGAFPTQNANKNDIFRRTNFKANKTSQMYWWLSGKKIHVGFSWKCLKESSQNISLILRNYLGFF